MAILKGEKKMVAPAYYYSAFASRSFDNILQFGYCTFYIHTFLNLIIKALKDK